jgi:hypothetical protein
MNAIDERLRAAMRETAGEITPDGIPPLRLPPGQAGRLGVAHGGGTPRWRWLAPLSAAAAVVVTVVVALALASGLPRPSPRYAAVPESAPPYYVALALTGNGDCCRPGLPYSPPTDAVVRATATGTALAMITPPRPYGTFIGVTAAADDRTFVLAAVELAPLPLTEAPATGLFLLRIDPANPVPSARARLTPLPVTVRPPGAGVTGLALSPDGRKLAVAEVYPIAAPPALHVVTLATGAEQAWAAATGGPTFGPGATGEPLSWAQDGRTLAFAGSGTAVRLLNTAAAGSSLLASSRLVVSAPNGDLFPYWDQVIITPDGQTIIAVIEIAAEAKNGHRVTVRQELVTFSARTGKLLHVLDRVPVYGNPMHILWASPSGQVLIVSGTQPGATVGPVNTGSTAGVLRDGRFTPIPCSNRTFAASW